MGVTSTRVKYELIFPYRGSVLGSSIFLEGTLITDLTGNYLYPGFVIRELFVNTLMFSAITTVCTWVLTSEIRSIQIVYFKRPGDKQIEIRLRFHNIIGIYLQINLRRLKLRNLLKRRTGACQNVFRWKWIEVLQFNYQLLRLALGRWGAKRKRKEQKLKTN